jgi:hypothetical protein
MTFPYIMGIFFTKHGLFFQKVSFIINTISPIVRRTLYVGRVKFFTKASERFTNQVFQLVLRKTASSERTLQGEKRWKSGGPKAGV